MEARYSIWPLCEYIDLGPRIVADRFRPSFAASDKHLHHTVRVAARDAPKFSATLHIDLQGNVTDKDGKKKPFKNGGRKDEGSCDFDRTLFQVI